MEVQDTEDWAFRSVGGEFGLKITEGWTSVPFKPLRLFDTSPSTGRYLAAGPNNLVYGSTVDLFNALKTNGDPNLKTISHPGILQLQILANGVQAATYDSSNNLSMYNLANGTLDWKQQIPTLTSLVKVSSKSKLAFVASGKLWELDDELREVCDASLAAYDRSGCCATSVGNKVTYNSEVIDLQSEVCGIAFVANDELLLVTGNNEDYDLHIWTKENGVRAVNDVAEPFGDNTRAFTLYSGSIDWVDQLWVATAAASTDMTLANTSAILAPYEDADRAILPLGESEISPVGGSLDSSIPLPANGPFPGIDDGVASPVWWILTNEGRILGWHVVSKEAVRNNTPLPVSTAAPGSVIKPENSVFEKINDSNDTKAGEDTNQNESESESEIVSSKAPVEDSTSLEVGDGELEKVDTNADSVSTEDQKEASSSNTFTALGDQKPRAFGSTGAFGKTTNIQFAENTSLKPKTSFTFSAPPLGGGFANFANTKSSPFGTAPNNTLGSASRDSPSASFAKPQPKEQGSLFSRNDEKTQHASPFAVKANDSKPSIFPSFASKKSTIFNSGKIDAGLSQKDEQTSSNEIGKTPAADISKLMSSSHLGESAEPSPKNTKLPPANESMSSDIDESDTTEDSKSDSDAEGGGIPTFGGLNLNGSSATSGAPQNTEQKIDMPKLELSEEPSVLGGFGSRSNMLSNEPKSNDLSNAPIESKGPETYSKMHETEKPKEAVPFDNGRETTVKGLDASNAGGENSSNSGSSGRAYDPVEATEWDGSLRGYMLDVIPCSSPALSDIDRFYAETNSMFQVLDHNLSVLGNILKTNGSGVESFEKLNNETKSLDLEVKSNDQFANTLSKTEQLRSVTTSILDETVSLGAQVASFEAELSKEAYLLRPLTLDQSEIRDKLRRKLAQLSARLGKAESELFISWVVSGRTFNIADLSVAIKKVDTRITEISRRVNRLPQNQENADALAQLSLNDPAEIIDISADYNRRKRLERDVGEFLTKRSPQSVMQ